MRTKHRIGRYRIIAPIGAGGFSTVYRALDEENDREVAIKVLAENHSMVPETRRRFVDEYNLRATVRSPFIAKMYEVGVVEETGQPFMVLELATRGDLRRRVEEIRRSHQVLNRADLMMLARHLTEALSALHSADIVHRDVSPGNILIRSRPSSGARQGSLERGNVTLLEPGERFLLADLGHAKDLIRSSGFTAGGGTQGFAAPEQRDDITVVDHRADIFSATAIIEWAAHDGIHADALEPFCDIGLAEDPDDRYASMGAWYDGISAALGLEREGAGPTRRRGRGRRGARAAVNGWSSNPLDGTSLASRVFGGGRFEAVSDDGDGVERARTGRWSRRASIAVFCLAAAMVLAAVGAMVVDRRATSGPTGQSEGLDSTSPTTLADATGPTTTGPLVVQPDELAGLIPSATLSSPDDLATIDEDLVIAGTVEDAGPTAYVELTIQEQSSGRFWTANGPSTDGDPFPVELGEAEGGDPTSRPFRHVIPADHLVPGRYVIQIWARTLEDQGPGDPIVKSITVG